MRSLRRIACLLCLALLLTGTASAAEHELEAVSALLKPSAEGTRAEPDDTALQALLANPAHEPWRLVEHLLAQGRQDLAIRLAERVRETVVGPLVVYASAPDALEGAANRANLLHVVWAALGRGDDTEALKQADLFLAAPGRVSVFAVDVQSVRGQLLRALGRDAEGLEAQLAAGETALSLGCWSLAEWNLEQAQATALAAMNFELVARAVEGMRALKELRGDSGPLADAIQNQGLIAAQRGDLPGALRHYDEAQSMYEQLGQLDDVAQVRSERSQVLAELGDFRAALAEQQVLADYHAERPRDALWAQHRVQLGLVRFRLGDEQGASQALGEAVEAFRAQGNQAGEAFAEANLGLTYLLGGRWEEALGHFRSTLTTMQALGDLANVGTAQNNVAEALLQGARADLHAADQAVDPTEREAARARARVSLTDAHAQIEAAIKIHQALGAQAALDNDQQTVGEILLLEGQAAKALALLAPVRDQARRLGAWSLRISATVSLARAHLQLKDWANASREARAAVDELARAFGGLAGADLARVRSLTPDIYDIGASAALQQNQPEDLLYFLESGRAAALLRGLGGRAAALRATVPELLLTRYSDQSQAKVSAFQDWQQAKSTRPTEVRELWKRYEGLRATEQETLDEIGEVQAQAALRLAPVRLVSVDDIKSRLRTTARPKQRQVMLLFNFQADAALALVVEATASPRVVSYARSDLPALYAAFASLSSSRQGELDPAALATVRRLLIDPLQIPSGPTRLLVSPDRELAYVPLCAVLADDWEIAWEPSATTYDLLAERRLRKGQHVLGLGDSDYGATPDVEALATRGGPRLVRIPASAAEVEAITSGPEDRRLLFTKATEGGLRRELESAGPERPWKSVHLACHGLVDVELPARSCLALTPGDGEDGFLLANEVLRLPLRTDLAVLSACQTGRGKLVRGEGVMSLTRAFMFAGAPRVLVSLWDVDDAATSFLMQAFYKEWTAGRGTAEALRRAQLAVRDHTVEVPVLEPGQPARNETRHPWAAEKFWAAWALWGLAD